MTMTDRTPPPDALRRGEIPSAAIRAETLPKRKKIKYITRES
ncbi:hypothetical protein ACQSME_08805 [Streptomyces sp. 2-6]